MNGARIRECTDLSAEILKNFELSELPVSSIILKCLRLCRLLGDEDGVLLFTYESSGYPSDPNGLTPEAWRISRLAGRHYVQKETDQNGNEQVKEYASTALTGELEASIAAQQLRLQSSADPNISLSSANPHQLVQAPHGNSLERDRVVTYIQGSKKTLQKVTGCLYNYISQIYNKLSYGNIVEDTFTRSRLEVNDKLAALCPQAIGKFVSVYENMDSDNPEDWANAVHSCRRILSDLADALYPPRNEPVIVDGKSIKVGKDQYINRLVQYIASKKGSRTFANVVGADLNNIGKRLDAIYEAVNKGTHADITKDAASRYIIHTYLLISDIITLTDKS